MAILFSSLTFIITPVIGQNQQTSAPALDWQKDFSGEEATWIDHTIDGGFTFYCPAHQSRAYNDLNYATLTKINSAGIIQWSQNYSSPFPEQIVTTTDNGYAFTTLNLNILTLSKLDPNGKSQWNQTIGTQLTGNTLLIQTNDNGYAIAIQNETSRKSSTDTGYVIIHDLIIFKVDSQGKTQWIKTTQLPECDDNFRSFIQTKDGGYALTGSSTQPKENSHSIPIMNSETDFVIVKIDSQGNLQWTKKYGGTKNDDPYTIIQTNDGGFAVIGNTQSFGLGGWDALLVKTDATGNLLWAHAYGGCGRVTVLHGQTGLFDDYIGDLQLEGIDSTGANNDYAYSLVQTIDNGFAFAGKTEYDPTTGSNTLMWLVSTDTYGNTQWNKTYANTHVDPVGQWRKLRWGINMLIQAKDGSFIMAGYEGESLNRWDQNTLIIKTKHATESPITAPSPSPMSSLSLQPITINADGTITPPSAPITQEGKEYKIIKNLNNPLIVKADNIIINGQRHLLNGNGTISNLFVRISPAGINLSNVKNVEIKNVNIQNFKEGILLHSSKNITISQNFFTRNEQAILDFSSSDTIISQNEMLDKNQGGVSLISSLNSKIKNNLFSQNGVNLEKSDGCIIAYNHFNKSECTLQNCTNVLFCGNNFNESFFALRIYDSNHNTIAANTYAKCHIGIDIGSSSENLFYLNNFLTNEFSALIPPETYNGGTPLPIQKINYWDNAEVGNYWSNYTEQYPNSKQTNEGTWITPYEIAQNNIDNHPLTDPVTNNKIKETSEKLISEHQDSKPPNPIFNPTTNTTIIVTLAIIATVLIIAVLIYRKNQK